jgi:hypothetical protein
MTNKKRFTWSNRITQNIDGTKRVIERIKHMLVATYENKIKDGNLNQDVFSTKTLILSSTLIWKNKHFVLFF